jgi:hypothetical protein
MISTLERYDLVILGSGSKTLAALHTAELGKTAIMTEFRMNRGTCTNRGCQPSKYLILFLPLVVLPTPCDCSRQPVALVSGTHSRFYTQNRCTAEPTGTLLFSR